MDHDPRRARDSTQFNLKYQLCRTVPKYTTVSDYIGQMCSVVNAICLLVEGLLFLASLSGSHKL